LIQIADSRDVKSSFLELTKHQAHVEAQPPGHAAVPRNSQEPAWRWLRTNSSYFLDQVHFLRVAEHEFSMPSLFNALATARRY
jgi:hypothetical protein